MSYLIFKFQGDGDGDRATMITSLPHFCPKSQQIKTDGFGGQRFGRENGKLLCSSLLVDIFLSTYLYCDRLHPM